MVQYCEHHTTLDSDDGPAIPGAEKLIRPGGDGTPAIAEFTIVDIAARRHTGRDSAYSYIADVLNLKYRLPRLWARVGAGEVPVWRAAKIAQASRHLTAQAAARVDRDTYRCAESIGPTRLDRIVAAAVIAADPAEADQQAASAADTRTVDVSRSSQQGLKTMFIRGDAPDVIRFDGAVDFIADLLKLDGDTDRKQIRRAKAIGFLADPNAALDLFARTRGSTAPVLPDELDYHLDGTPRPAASDQPATDDIEPIDEDRITTPCTPAAETTGRHRPAGPGGSYCSTCGHGTRWTLHTPRELDRRFPTTRLYLHLNEDTFRGVADDPARLEQSGPLTALQARDLLGHSRVILTPVLDLPGMAPVDAYEIRGRMREAVFIKSAGASCFPYSDILAPPSCLPRRAGAMYKVA